jgi:hypothetical protein
VLMVVSSVFNLLTMYPTVCEEQKFWDTFEVILYKSSQVFEVLQQKVFEESQGDCCMSLLPTKDPNIYELDYFNIADNEAEEKDLF